MRQFIGRLALSGGLILSASAAMAEGNCNGWADLASPETITLAKVSAAPHANFVKNGTEQAGCPAAGASCQRKGFVVSGDVVIVSSRQNGFACAQYVDARGLETTGWLPASALTEEPAAAPASLNDWAGEWSGNPEQSISVKAGKGARMVVLHGDATYGALDPARVKRGAVNIGAFDANVRLDGNLVAFAIGDGGKTLPYDKGEEFACKIRMVRLGPFLMVEDNRQCGGNNVSFAGDYRRK